MRLSLSLVKVGWLLLLVCEAPVSAARSAGIEWNRANLTLVARGAGYARMARLQNNDILCIYESGGKVWIKRSKDNGKSWIEPLRVATYPYGSAANPEILPLRNGWILGCYNERPKDGTHPFAIVTTISKDGGRTWSAGKQVYQADILWENGCWEPAAIQTPTGKIQLFFANEGPYRSTHEQEITLLRSSDNGENWSEPQKVSFRAKHRDGMPVPLVLSGRHGIVLAIEDDGIDGAFKPAIVRTGASANWQGRFVDGQSTKRWAATNGLIPTEVYAGAPYIRQMPTGETILSLQANLDGRKKPHMVVFVGDDWAKNFSHPSVPFQVDSRTACLWNSLFVKDENTVTAVSGTVQNGIGGVWAIDGRLIRAK